MNRPGYFADHLYESPYWAKRVGVTEPESGDLFRTPIGINTVHVTVSGPSRKKGTASAMPQILAPKSFMLPERGLEPPRPCEH